MITRAELEQWIKESGTEVTQVDNTYQFSLSNPWEPIEDGEDYGIIKLSDGIIIIDWAWNGYGEEKYKTINEFSARFSDVMQNGLTG